MDVSPVITYLLIFVCCVIVVSAQNAQNQTRIPSPAPNATIVASEGGTVSTSTGDASHTLKMHLDKDNDTTHMGREHMLKVNHDHNDHSESTTQPQQVPPFEVGQKNDNKTSVAKKDAILSVPVKPKAASNTTTSTTTTTTTSTTSTTTTTTAEPHKPTITLGEDEELPSSDTKAKPNGTGKHGISIESVTEKSKKTDYVVPIVAVILSVPIVAIVCSVLYKRGSDWWQHRHYRRMDFLIEGMYNN